MPQLWPCCDARHGILWVVWCGDEGCFRDTQHAKGLDKLQRVKQSRRLEYKGCVDAWRTGGIFWINHAISHI